MSHRLRLTSGTLKIAKASKDALSTAYDDLLFDGVRLNSRAKMAGVLTGTGTDAGDYSSGYRRYIIQAHHGLGYIPQANFFLNVNDGFAIMDTSDLTYTFVRAYTGTPPSTYSTTNYCQYIIFYDRLV